MLALGAAAIPAAAAWACVPQPYLLVQPRPSGPPGGKVEVAGTNFEAGPPEIRWNAVDGTLLGKAQSPEFKLTVTVPDDEEGLYSLVAVSRGAQGQVNGVARTSFAVTGTAPRTGAAAAPALAARENSSGTSPLPAMALGAALTGAGVVGGAALTRRRASAGSSG